MNDEFELPDYSFCHGLEFEPYVPFIPKGSTEEDVLKIIKGLTEKFSPEFSITNIVVEAEDIGYEGEWAIVNKITRSPTHEELLNLELNMIHYRNRSATGDMVNLYYSIELTRKINKLPRSILFNYSSINELYEGDDDKDA